MTCGRFKVSRPSTTLCSEVLVCIGTPWMHSIKRTGRPAPVGKRAGETRKLACRSTAEHNPSFYTIPDNQVPNRQSRWALGIISEPTFLDSHEGNSSDARCGSPLRDSQCE